MKPEAGRGQDVDCGARMCLRAEEGRLASGVQEGSLSCRQRVTKGCRDRSGVGRRRYRVSGGRGRGG